jgi:Leucine Rich repeats (2 copies)
VRSHLLLDSPRRIPADWVAIEYLSFLYLDNNQLSGSIPSDLGNLPALTVLDIYSNRLTGAVPEGVCHLVSSGILSVEVDCGEVTCECGCLCA